VRTGASPAQFFSTHGYFLLRGALSADEADRLRAEVVAALSANHELPLQPVAEPTGTGVGFYLPMMGPRTPLSRALLADGRTLGVARQLLGDVLPKPAKGIQYRDATPWHADSYDRALTAVKVVTYLEPLTADTGALRVLPGSQHADVSASLSKLRAEYPLGAPVLDERRETELFPGLALDCRPGDVIFFDVRLWHASLFGRNRLQWSVSYAAMPRTQREEKIVRDYILLFLDSGQQYDSERYPYFDPDWSQPDAPHYAKVLTRICS
jgi:phytanoyl-CoA dioxygenase PhyH